MSFILLLSGITMANISILTDKSSAASFTVTIKWLEMLSCQFQLLKVVYSDITESDTHITVLIDAL